MSTHLPFLYIAPSKLGGRGVFTSRVIPTGTTIEIAPIIRLNLDEMALIHETKLHDYYFLWGEHGCAIALGYGSLYNHSRKPNTDYEMNFDTEDIRYFALKDIPAGSELLINYTDDKDDRTKLWFEE